METVEPPLHAEYICRNATQNVRRHFQADADGIFSGRNFEGQFGEWAVKVQQRHRDGRPSHHIGIVGIAGGAVKHIQRSV